MTRLFPELRLCEDPRPAFAARRWLHGGPGQLRLPPIPLPVRPTPRKDNSRVPIDLLMKTILLLLALLMAGCATISQDSPENRRALATRVVNLQQPEQQLKEMREQVKRMMSQTVGQMAGPTSATPEGRQRAQAVMDQVWKVMDKYLTAEKLRSLTIEAYSATFTTGELASLERMYATDAGKTLVAKQPELARRLMEASQAMMKEAMPELRRVGMEAALEAKKEEPPASPVPAAAPGAPVSEAVRKLAADTYPDVQGRYNHARELDAQGKSAEALAEYLWCYDEGMRRSAAFTGVRQSFLLHSVVALSQQYPPARQALQDRRDAARLRLQEDPTDSTAQMDFAALNRELGEASATLAFYDQLPAGSPGRATLGRMLFDQLLSAKRYSEAAAAQPYAQFKQMFEMTAEHMKTRPDPTGRMMSMYVGQSGAKELEALAGAGELDQAKELLQLLLNADHSDDTLFTLRLHLERAGHAELLPPKEPPASP